MAQPTDINQASLLASTTTGRARKTGKKKQAPLLATYSSTMTGRARIITGKIPQENQEIRVKAVLNGARVVLNFLIFYIFCHKRGRMLKRS